MSCRLHIAKNIEKYFQTLEKSKRRIFDVVKTTQFVQILPKQN